MLYFCQFLLKSARFCKFMLTFCEFPLIFAHFLTHFFLPILPKRRKMTCEAEFYPKNEHHPLKNDQNKPISLNSG